MVNGREVYYFGACLTQLKKGYVMITKVSIDQSKLANLVLESGMVDGSYNISTIRARLANGAGQLPSEQGVTASLKRLIEDGLVSTIPSRVELSKALRGYVAKGLTTTSKRQSQDSIWAALTATAKRINDAMNQAKLDEEELASACRAGAAASAAVIKASSKGR